MGVGHLMLFHHCFQLRWESPFYLLLHFFCLVLPTTFPTTFSCDFLLLQLQSCFADTFFYLQKDSEGEESPPTPQKPRLSLPSLVPTYCWMLPLKCHSGDRLLGAPHPCQFPSDPYSPYSPSWLSSPETPPLFPDSTTHLQATRMKTADFIPCITVFKFPFSSILKTENQGVMWWPMLIILAFSGLKQEDCELFWARLAVWVIKLDHVSKQTKAQETKPGLLPLLEIPAQTTSKIQLLLASSRLHHPEKPQGTITLQESTIAPSVVTDGI